MQLEGNFYHIEKIEQIAEGEFDVSVVLHASHPIYVGHFPGKPVVPGVCTLTVIKEILGKICLRKVVFSSIKECKYVSALLPKEDIGITVHLSITGSNLVKAMVHNNDNQQVVLKLKANFS